MAKMTIASAMEIAACDHWSEVTAGNVSRALAILREEVLRLRGFMTIIRTEREQAAIDAWPRNADGELCTVGSRHWIEDTSGLQKQWVIVAWTTIDHDSTIVGVRANNRSLHRKNAKYLHSEQPPEAEPEVKTEAPTVSLGTQQALQMFAAGWQARFSCGRVFWTTPSDNLVFTSQSLDNPPPAATAHAKDRGDITDG